MERQRTARTAKGKASLASVAKDGENPPSNDTGMVPPFTREQLSGLKRRDLQALCKAHNMKSTGKVRAPSAPDAGRHINKGMRDLEWRAN